MKYGPNIYIHWVVTGAGRFTRLAAIYKVGLLGKSNTSRCEIFINSNKIGIKCEPDVFSIDHSFSKDSFGF